MTPKEKAEELVSKFSRLSQWVGGEGNISLGAKMGKQCAIMCVQQIIKEMHDCLEVTGSSYVKEEIRHWDLVLNILNKS